MQIYAYIYHAIFRVGRGVGDYLKYSPVSAKIVLLCWEIACKDLKKQYSLKLYMTMKYQFICAIFSPVKKAIRPIRFAYSILHM